MNTGAKGTTIATQGILIVWTDIPLEIENDFNDWYNREHLPDRVGRMPGFLRGRRYVATAGAAGTPKYLTYYDLQSTDVMLSDAPAALRTQRPPRDQLFVPRFRNTLKGICDVACRAGEASVESEGDYLVLLPVAVNVGREEAFARGVCDHLLPVLKAVSGVASALYARSNAAVTQASSAKDDRNGDRYVDGLIAVEAMDLGAADAAAAQLQPKVLTTLGGAAQWVAAPSVLRLRHTVSP